MASRNAICIVSDHVCGLSGNNILVLAVFAAVRIFLIAPSRAEAGLGDTPLPHFSDGKPSVEILAVAGLVKRVRLQTHFLCTSVDGVPIDIGVEVFDETGVLRNDVQAGVGALLDVAPGATVTIATSTTAALLESVTIPLADISQGSARVVASTSQVRCTVLLVDDAVTPPVTLVTLRPGVRLGVGAGLPGPPLPDFADGKPATHAVLIPGVVKRGRMETNVFCTSLASAPVNLAVQMFESNGTLRNDVTAGNGAVLNVAPGTTVTFGSTGTAAFLETTVITIAGVSQGVARVVGTSGDVICSAMMLDSDLAPPTAMTDLVVYDVSTPTPAGNVDGHIRYYTGDRPVPGVEVALLGGARENTMTDATGAFAFADIPVEPRTLRPTKTGDFRNGISSLDAARVLQAAVGLITLTSMQSLACDVTGNGMVSSLDAARILQLVVGLLPRFNVGENCGSDWLFIPDPQVVANQSSVEPQISSTACQPGAIAFNPLMPPAEGQDFIAVLLGDCTGNWQPTP